MSQSVFAVKNSPQCNRLVLGGARPDTSITNAFNGTPIARELPPIILRRSEDDRACPTGDIGLLYGVGCLFVSAKARAKLGPFLDPVGQYINATSECGDYSLFNITALIDSLDVEHSSVEFWPASSPPARGQREIRYVRAYAFRMQLLDTAVLFKLPQFPLTHVFATDGFVKAFAEEDLTGLSFSKLWPLPTKDEIRGSCLERRRRKRKRPS